MYAHCSKTQQAFEITMTQPYVVALRRLGSMY